MINKKQIQNNLTQINNLYNKNTGKNMKSLFYSKLAIIELCGWIEESMDDMIRILAKSYLKEKNNLDYVDDPVIKLTHGFDYNGDLRNMLMRLIGVINIEKLENSVDVNKFHIMKSTLGSLKQCRDVQAHTHVKGTTQRIDSPSLTLNRFQKIYEGLKDVELCIRQMRFWIL